MASSDSISCLLSFEGNLVRLREAWEYALARGEERLADEAAEPWASALEADGCFAQSAECAQRHIEGFPQSSVGYRWAGNAALRAGDPRAALAPMQRAVELARGLGRPAGELEVCLQALGRVFAALGRHQEATLALKEALDLLELAPEDGVRSADEAATDPRPTMAILLHELGEVRRTLGDLPAARAYLEQALDLGRELVGSDLHPWIAGSWRDLGGVLWAAGDLDAAREHLEKALSILREVLKTDVHRGVAVVLHELAGVLGAQCNLEGARQCLEQSLSILRALEGTDLHPDIAASLYTIAGVLRLQERHEEAATLYARVLDIEEAVYGTAEQPHSAQTEIPYGIVLLHLGRVDEGLKRLYHARELLKAQMPAHPFLPHLERFFGQPDKRSGARVAPSVARRRTPSRPTRVHDEIQSALQELTKASLASLRKSLSS